MSRKRVNRQRKKVNLTWKASKTAQTAACIAPAPKRARAKKKKVKVK